jgi:C1A family cysteine protease
LEGAYKVKQGALVNFSEQQLVDCSDENNGCNGGDMGLAFDYLKKYKIEKETDYPYTGRDGTCKYSATKGVINTRGHVNVKANSPTDLINAAALGTVSIALEADTYVFQSYKGGIISSTSCGTNLDHGVLLVGYGKDATLGDYWLLKNSWGTGWGEKGYFRIKRDATKGPGICGLQKEPVYPTL